MFKYNISKTYKCVYCNEVETLRHLFFECTFNSQLLLLIENWIFTLSNSIICLNFKNIVLQDIEISNEKIKSVILLIISLYCKTVWLNRNVKKKWMINKRSHLIYYFLHYKTNHCYTNIQWISSLVIFRNLPKFSILIEIKKIKCLSYLN
jgi:hypothetical protein